MTELEKKLEYILNEKTSKIVSSNIRLGVTIFDVEGNLEPDKPDQTKTATPSTSQQTIEPDVGYELASVTVEAVTNSIDSNIQAGNIKSGVEILGVTGTYEGEAKLNIYTQNTEPTGKNGIWLKSNSINTNTIIEDESVFGSEEWNTDKMSELRVIPFSFTYGSAILVREYVYLFYMKNAYKYNALTDTYTQLTNIPYDFYQGDVTSIGTDIYLFGSGSNAYRQYAYKYDTLTDTYTQLTNIPYYFVKGEVASVGTDVYLFSSDNSTYRKYVYKYSTLQNTYTRLTDIPEYSFYDGAVVSVGTDIYMFGVTTSGNERNLTYKYNTINNTYTKLANLSYHFYRGSVVSTGTDIYVFGGYNSNENHFKANKYTIASNTYTTLDNIPYAFAKGGAALIEDGIYLFGGDEHPTKVQVMNLVPKTYTNNSIVIANNNTNKYQTELISINVAPNGLKYHFNNFWYATTNNNVTTFDTTTPAYYGNGTEWLGLRNPAALSVELSDSTLEIEMGNTATLTATVKPINATTKTVTWSSDDSTVATVSNGVVTPVAEGTCTITVTTTDGGFTDTCYITVTGSDPYAKYREISDTNLRTATILYDISAGDLDIGDVDLEFNTPFNFNSQLTSSQKTAFVNTYFDFSNNGSYAFDVHNSTSDHGSNSIIQLMSNNGYTFYEHKAVENATSVIASTSWYYTDWGEEGEVQYDVDSWDYTDAINTLNSISAEGGLEFSCVDTTISDLSVVVEVLNITADIKSSL